MWTSLGSAGGTDGIAAFDCTGPGPVSASVIAAYPLQWLYAIMTAFKTVAVPAALQTAAVAPVGLGLDVSSVSITFPSNTAAGSAIIFSIGFFTSYGYSLADFETTLSCTDSQGNVYTRCPTSDYVFTFIATNILGGPLTVTFATTVTGLTSLGDYGAIASEVSGIAHSSPLDAWSQSSQQGSVALSLTSPGNDFIHLAIWSRGYSPVTAAGGTNSVAGLTHASGPFRWRPKVSARDLFNAVKGTFIAPGNNWQSSDFPPYAQDSLHGYGGSPLDFPLGDANLAADGGTRRYLDIQLPFTISTSAAQRIAKIELLRRRQQGTGTFAYDMALYLAATLDVVQMTLPFFGWVNKLLEIAVFRFRISQGEIIGTEIDVQETDPSVYAWSTAEELTPAGYSQAVMPTNVGVTGNGITSGEFSINGT